MRYKVGDTVIDSKGTKFRIRGIDEDCYVVVIEGDYIEMVMNDKTIDHEATKSLSSDARECDLTKDNVNHPLHYTKGEIETIDKIKYLTREYSGICAVSLGNFIKYIDRCNLKGGWEDLEKADWYMNKFIDEFYDELVESIKD